ncbi:hypothetical protein HHI36_005633 [Cryptolaemus montrouzieri]|uniref:Uncharacterized protein n=1 Tax=Cryptolaemus montrouzieri TaxID=559131 RepID=A0ABD2NVK9_9CUCU
MPDSIDKVRNYVTPFEDGFVLSYAAAELWENNRMRIEIVYIQLIAPLIPIALHISNRDYKNALEYVILGSIISFIAASILCGCIYGILAACVYGIATHLHLWTQVDDIMPPVMAKNYLMCVFSFLLLHSLEHI